MIVHAIAQEFAVPNSVLLGYGPLGFMVLWFAPRAERVLTKLADLAHRIDGLTRALLVDMVERESSGSHTKAYAREAIAKNDARNEKDADK